MTGPLTWLPLADWAFDVAVEINNAFKLGLSDAEMRRAARIILRRAKQRGAS